MNTLFNRYTPVMAPLIHPQPLCLHHLCCWRTGLAMWQADGMALHQASLCSTPPKLKRECRKTEGHTTLAPFSETLLPKNKRAPSGIFHIPAVVPDKQLYDPALCRSRLIPLINVTKGELQSIYHPATQLLGYDASLDFGHGQISSQWPSWSLTKRL